MDIGFTNVAFNHVLYSNTIFKHIAKRDMTVFINADIITDEIKVLSIIFECCLVTISEMIIHKVG